ncbi:MAG: hypothetical protein GY811_26545 [Myxococcales bacterium]|nr:hypothetical protein [Myxococcales bacterium]
MKTPTFIVEGSSEGNGPYDVPSELQGKAPISTTIVPGATQFSVLRPGSEVVAAAIIDNTEEQSNIRITAAAIASRLKASPPKPVK